MLKAKSCEIKSFSPFMRRKIVSCKLAAVMFFSLMFKFKHTAFSKFRYVGEEFIYTLHRNSSPIFVKNISEIFNFRENNFLVSRRIFIVLCTSY